MKITTTCSVLVDYNRSAEKGINSGKYDLVDNPADLRSLSTERVGCIEIKIKLIDLSDVNKNKHIDRDEVLNELAKNGLRPAELSELLVLGEKFPNLQKKFEIIALGSVCKKKMAWQRHHDWYYPAICMDGMDPKKRKLKLDTFTFCGAEYIRFAAIDK